MFVNHVTEIFFPLKVNLKVEKEVDIFSLLLNKTSVWWPSFWIRFFKTNCNSEKRERDIQLLPLFCGQEGRYEYKYIVDGKWMCNKYELVTNPNKDGHVNNYVEVHLPLIISDPYSYDAPSIFSIFPRYLLFKFHICWKNRCFFSMFWRRISKSSICVLYFKESFDWSCMWMRVYLFTSLLVYEKARISPTV